MPEHKVISAGLVTLLALGAIVPASPAMAETEKKVPTPRVIKTVNGQTSTHTNVGNHLTYEITSTLSDDITNSEHCSYTICDSYDPAIAIDMGSIKVTVDGKAVSTEWFTTNTFDNVLRVKFADIHNIPSVSAQSEIRVTYQATLSPGATTGAKTNDNLAWSEWDGGQTEKTNAKVASYALNITKTDEDSSPLAGAEFTIANQDGKYVQTNGTLGTKPVTFTSDAKGCIKLRGLDSGTYHIVETSAPDGFLPVEPFDVTINATYDVSGVPRDLAASTSAPSTTIVNGTDATSGTVSLTVIDAHDALHGGKYGKTGVSMSGVMVLVAALAAGGITLAVRSYHLKTDDE